MSVRRHCFAPQSFPAFGLDARATADLWRIFARRIEVPAPVVERGTGDRGGRWHLLVAAEDRCGDAVDSLPVFARLAQRAEKLDLLVMPRDAHSERMDAHRSPRGELAIPLVPLPDVGIRQSARFLTQTACIATWLACAATSGAAQRAPRVENPTPNAAATLRLARVATVSPQSSGESVSERNGLWAVRTATFTPQGTLIVVLDGGAQIREYDATGRPLGTIGRAGDGPGEFRHAETVVSLPGDSLLVHDAQSRRLTMFGPDRRPVRTITTEGPARCCTLGGSYLVQVAAPRATSGAPAVGYTSYGVASWRGAPAATPGEELRIATRPPTVVLEQSTGGGGTFSFAGVHRLPFAALPMTTFLGDLVVNSDGARYEYRMIGLDGTPARTVRVARAPVEVPAAELRRVRDSVGAIVPDAGDRRRLLAAFDAAQTPTTFPAFDRMLADDPAGALWIRTHAPDAARPEHWSRFTRDGRLEGTLTLPRGWRAVAFSRGQAIMVEEDDTTGLQRIHVHVVERDAAGSRR